MRLLIPVTVVGLVVAAAACSDPLTSADGKVEVRVEADGVSVRNQTALPLYYYLVERVTAETLLYLWAPCVDPDDCPRIAPGATLTIPLDQIFGWKSDSREVTLYYWHLVHRQGEFEPDAIRSISAGIQ